MRIHTLKMSENVYMFLFLLFLLIPMVKGAIPGTFFWRPRLGIDLSIPTTEKSTSKVHAITRENIREGVVVLINPYAMGMTVLGIAAGISSAKPYPHLNPFRAYFYTNVYRWILRYLSLVPFWAGGASGHLCETHKVWVRRFYYMDEMVPNWLRKMLVFVDKDDWVREDIEHRRFKTYAEPAFGKHFRYPTKVFNNFVSYLTKETEEVFDSSAASVMAE